MVESEGIPQKKWCALQKKRERKRKNYSKNGVLHQNQNSPLPHSAKSSSLFQNVNILKLCVLSHSVVSDSLRPDGLWPARLLCPWGFSRQEYWNGLLCPPPGDLPRPGIKPRPPALLAYSLPSEPTGKPLQRSSLASAWDLSNPGIEPRSPELQTLYQLRRQGSPRILERAAYPFSRGSS